MKVATMRDVRHITNSETATKEAAITFMNVRAYEKGERDQNPINDEVSAVHYRNAVDILASVNKTIKHIKMIVKRDILDNEMGDAVDVFPEGSLIHTVTHMGKATGLAIVDDIVAITLDSLNIPLMDFVNLSGYKLHTLVVDEIAIAKENANQYICDNMGEPKTLASASDTGREGRSRIAAPRK